MCQRFLGFHCDPALSKRSVKTKARTRDLDQIFEDMEPKNFEKLVLRAMDPDLPGFGQNYCVPVMLNNYCARHFITAEAKLEHIRSKLHKKRV